MAYVPVVIAASQPSARARELAKAITFLIDEYKRKDSKVTDSDITQALGLVQSGRKGAPGTSKGPLIAVALALLGLGIFFALLYNLGFIF